MSTNASHVINVSRLKKLVNPLQSYCWQDIRKRITIKDIQKRLASSESPEYQEWEQDTSEDVDNRHKHIEQIAWLVQHGSWKDHPIDIDIGVPGLCEPRWIVQDGNHRLAAIIFLYETQNIDIQVYCDISGSMRHAKELGFDELPEINNHEPQMD